MESSAPDFANGFPLDQLPDGKMIQGRVGDDEVLLVRRGQEFFALGAHCTHYGGALAEGLMVRDELRCPLHHACFSLRTGEALRAPAFDPIPCWRVERVGDAVFVREKLPAPAPRQIAVSSAQPQPPASIVIVGGGAAGLSAADMLRREGYDGPVTLISADDSAPYDRPNLSKDYLAGTAQDDWIPLRPPDYYSSHRIDLVLKSRVSNVDPERKKIRLEDGKTYDFGALLLATGAEPVKLSIPGAIDSHLHYLRSFNDSRAIAAKAKSAKQVVIVGGSFIALEAAAALRERALTVHVVAPERQPLERVLDQDLGRLLRELHQEHGVVFHLGERVDRVDGRKVMLSGGATLDADFILVGVGVQPSLALAEQSGLKCDRGVLVDEYLETSAPGIFAVGDIARWPDPYSGESVRIEHWVVAERQGQVAARNMLGRRERFDAVPFFWTQHYGLSIRYSGHAEKWDAIEIEGDIQAKDCAVAYKLGGSSRALATISRDLQSLQFEAAMEGSFQLRSAASPDPSQRSRSTARSGAV